MQNVVISLSTRVYRNQRVLRCAIFRFAASYEVWPRAAHCVLDDIREKACEYDANQEAEYCDMSFMEGWTGNDRPYRDENKRK